MEEIVMPLSVLLILLTSFAAFVLQIRRVRRGLCSRSRGVVLYAAYSAAPVVLFVAVFLLLVGVEELAETPLVGEGYARSLIIVAAGGAAFVVLGSIVFAAYTLVLKR
jgi:hypothetical protein